MLYVLNNVQKTYARSEKSRPALSISHLEIPSNKVIVIIGESGSGKTTLLNLLGTLDTPDPNHALPQDLQNGEQPSIRLYHPQENLSDEQDQCLELTSLSRRLRRQRSAIFGFVFQEGYLLQNFSSLSNVTIPLYINRLDQRNLSLEEYFDRVDLVPSSTFTPRLPRELSGGQAQRVAIIRSMTHQPRVILADEPSSRLDHDHGMQIMALLRNWCHSRDDHSLIWVTHNLEQAAKFSDHVIAIRDGRVIINEPLTHRDPAYLHHMLLRKTASSEEGNEEHQEHPTVPDEPTASVAAAETLNAGFFKRTKPDKLSMPLLQNFKFMLTFALLDIFPPVTGKKGIQGRFRRFLSAIGRHLKIIWGVRKTVHPTKAYLV
uniref:ABC-type lipoprotein export system, ATPase component n=1 Tax=Candidatus Kentrum sp. TUN TaxID=2126343 RepID=A0A451B0T5_9GAMM|nr:MAG: ABC-type lipoprotein export system, ATPase component [Candidatus Kentron sp. TUN]